MATPQPQKCNKTFEEHQVDYTPPNWKSAKPSRYRSQMSPLSILSQSDESILSILSQSVDSDVLEASLSEGRHVNQSGSQDSDQLEGQDTDQLEGHDTDQSEGQDIDQSEGQDIDQSKDQDTDKSESQDIDQSDDADSENIDTDLSTDISESNPATWDDRSVTEEAMEVEHSMCGRSFICQMGDFIMLYSVHHSSVATGPRTIGNRRSSLFVRN